MNAPARPKTATVSAPLPPKPASYIWLYVSLSAALLAWIVVDLELAAADLTTVPADIVEYFSRYTNPDLSVIPQAMALMGQTLAMALWGTFLAVMIAVLLAPLAAGTLTPHPWVHVAARELLNLLRSLPDLLLALILVAGVGLGPLPGVLALGLHTAGFLGKFFAEALERVDRGVYEGVRATGANIVQLTMFAGWPMTLRESAGYILYIVDRNVRMAAVLGLVGAGGIGKALYDALRIFEYERAAGLLLIVVAVIVAIDYGTTWIRGKLQ